MGGVVPDHYNPVIYHHTCCRLWCGCLLLWRGELFMKGYCT
jgi:hypothetical protein